jgi:uncharacterized membrane protein YhaH (DUF805 family)
MGKIFLYGFFYVCVNFMEKISLNVVLLSPFVGIAEMWQGFLQIKIILCWTIISFICALISQHNVRLGHKPSCITIF